jgi:hypothetical protein
VRRARPAFPAPSFAEGRGSRQNPDAIRVAGMRGCVLDAALLRDARLRELLRMRSEQVIACPHGKEAHAPEQAER